MGIKDFWTHALEGIKSTDYIPFKDAAGKKFAVDMSIWLYKLVKTEPVALCLNSSPPYPPIQLLHVLRSWIQKIREDGPKLLFVFDGGRHLVKHVARDERESMHNKSLIFSRGFTRRDALMRKSRMMRGRRR